jgi:hypothetical protein
MLTLLCALYIPEDYEGGVTAQLQGEALHRGGGGGGQQPAHLTRPGEGHHGYLTDTEKIY